MKKMAVLFCLVSLATVTGCTSNPAQTSHITPAPPSVELKTPQMGFDKDTASNNMNKTNPMPTADQPTTVTGSGGVIGGHIARTMDSNDRSKLIGALESSVGKSTRWTNENSNIIYTVISLKKVNINGNKFCRKYSIISEINGKQEKEVGTACINVKGDWVAM